MGGRNPDDESDESVRQAAARWKALRPRVRVGAVFRISDELVKPLTGSTKIHPYVIIAGCPGASEKARTAVTRFVQVSCRHSQNDNWVDPPEGVQSARDLELGLDKKGVFTVEQFTIQVRDLMNATFLGWLTRSELDQVLFRRGQSLITGPYPPDTR